MEKNKNEYWMKSENYITESGPSTMKNIILCKSRLKLDPQVQSLNIKNEVKVLRIKSKYIFNIKVKIMRMMEKKKSRNIGQKVEIPYLNVFFGKGISSNCSFW